MSGEARATDRAETAAHERASNPARAMAVGRGGERGAGADVFMVAVEPASESESFTDPLSLAREWDSSTVGSLSMQQWPMDLGID